MHDNFYTYEIGETPDYDTVIKESKSVLMRKSKLVKLLFNNVIKGIFNANKRIAGKK